MLALVVLALVVLALVVLALVVLALVVPLLHTRICCQKNLWSCRTPETPPLRSYHHTHSNGRHTSALVLHRNSCMIRHTCLFGPVLCMYRKLSYDRDLAICLGHKPLMVVLALVLALVVLALVVLALVLALVGNRACTNSRRLCLTYPNHKRSPYKNQCQT
jgi:hypothetical protein